MFEPSQGHEWTIASQAESLVHSISSDLKTKASKHGVSRIAARQRAGEPSNNRCSDLQILHQKEFAYMVSPNAVVLHAA